MTSFRTAIPAFQVANPLYVGATVFFREVDEDGNKTQTLAPLFANAIGSQTVANPQTLDSDGKFVRPVYIDRAVIAEIIGPTVGGHDTGIFRAAMNGKWGDAWQTDTLYEGNEFILDPATLSIYVALETYTSGSAIGDDISAGKLALVIDIGALDDDLPVIVANLSEIQTVAASIDDVNIVAGLAQAGTIQEIIDNLGAIGTVSGNIEDVNIVADNIGALTDVQAALAAGGFGTAAYADIGTGADQVPTNADLPPPAGLFRKAITRQVAWTKTGNNTAETQTALTVEVDGAVVEIPSGTPITMPTLIIGVDYAIWAAPDGTLEADASFSVAPTAGGRLVGGFHYAPGGNAPGFNSGGNTTPQINEYSFWDLKFRPACPDPRGMTLVAGKFWCDIYLLNVNHHVNGTSKFNVRIADDGDPPKVPEMFGGDGSATYSNANWWTMNEVLAAHGKQSLNYQEFAAAAYGVIEKTAGGTDPVDTILRENWTSIWGLMLAAGNMYVWGRDFGRGGNSESWSNNADGRGDTFALSRVARFGAAWADGSDAGSRASAWSAVPSDSGSSLGARGRSDHLNHE